nr:immunoglobulin heavy chain junction region [Macaca mulatta]MOW75540.1 immunoglobulin heavy chain junction region [Macaca mulatta]MOW75621.1 immunoglobulin heavy chain junction region [Macaca mulatta]MOW75720.1 immunoglobulin heavy chain junction region [Macaca mulatta]MOW75980.1 immunoglobulin heavy chain junction region [Macaca mulatta]
CARDPYWGDRFDYW